MAIYDSLATREAAFVTFGLSHLSPGQLPKVRLPEHLDTKYLLDCHTHAVDVILYLRLTDEEQRGKL